MMSSNKEAAQEATDNLAALIQDAKEFGKRPNVPVGNVRTDIGGADDVSAISFQSSSRSMMDKIRIVQDNTKTAPDVQSGDGVKVGEEENSDELRQTIEDWKDASKKQWQGIRRNAQTTIDAVKAKSQEIIEDQMKPGWKQIEGASKTIVRLKLKPLWEKSSEAAREMPELTKSTILKVRDSSLHQFETHLRPKFGFFRDFNENYSKYYLGKAPGVFGSRGVMSELKYQLLEQSLLSIATILQCENPATGIFIVVGLLLGSPVVAISGILALMSTLLFLRVYVPPANDSRMWPIRAGSNAFLAGTFLAASFDVPAPNAIMRFGGRLAISAVIGPTCLFVHSHLFPPSTTLPPLLWSFNLLVGVLLLGLGSQYPLSLTPLSSDSDDAYEDETTALDESRPPSSYSLVGATLSSISAIFGVTDPWSGLLILLGVSLWSRFLVAWLVIVTSAASMIAIGLLGMDARNVNAGLVGNEAALTVAACTYYFAPSKQLLLVVVLAAIWTCILKAAVATVFFKLT